MIAQDIDAGVKQLQLLVLPADGLTFKREYEVFIRSDDIVLGWSLLYDHVVEEGAAAATEGVHSILDVFEVLLELSGIQLVNGQVALFIVGSISQQGDGEQAAIGLVGARLAEFSQLPRGIATDIGPAILQRHSRVNGSPIDLAIIV